jgi:dGTPase
MGTGEGDFHRTRLTHSIECAQIGDGLLGVLQRQEEEDRIPKEMAGWLPERDLIEGACFAHDIGHPPFGHGGERALHGRMATTGGFEGNGHTLRIITRLEKYSSHGSGLDPTRRLILAVLKYPIPYSTFEQNLHRPPKCYFDEESEIVDWALNGFSTGDVARFRERGSHGKAQHRTFDCFLMELADDIAYGIHDIEDIVARRLVDHDELKVEIGRAFENIGGTLDTRESKLSADDVIQALYAGSRERKQIISRLVNAMVTSVTIDDSQGFQHPLLAFKPRLGSAETLLLEKLKGINFRLVVEKAKIQQLERRGRKIVTELYDALLEDPEHLVPANSWKDGETNATTARRVCDYVAGMTDAYAEKVYQRLFTPGFGSSSDEL